MSFWQMLVLVVLLAIAAGAALVLWLVTRPLAASSADAPAELGAAAVPTLRLSRLPSALRSRRPAAATPGSARGTRPR